MDEWLRIPTDRPRPHPVRLCVMMALTALLFLGFGVGPSGGGAPVREAAANR